MGVIFYPSGLPWAESFGAAVQKHKYNDKEFIEMHGLDEYDSEARWYYPAIMRTTTIDPLAEKYYSISPYAWCGNNPLNRIDPDGMIHYSINSEGYIVEMRDKEGNVIGKNDKFDMLYAVNDKGEANSDVEALKVNDQSILSGLATDRKNLKVSKTNTDYAVTNSSEVGNVYLFAANNSNVEWGLQARKNDEGWNYIIATSHKNYVVYTDNAAWAEGLDKNEILYDIHSHPGSLGYEGTKGASDTGDFKRVWGYYTSSGKDISMAYRFYVYHKKSQSLYKYSPWKNYYIGKVSGKNIFNPFNL